MSYADIERVYDLPLEHRKKHILVYFTVRRVCWAKTSTQIKETGICKSDYYALRGQLLEDGYVATITLKEALAINPKVPANFRGVIYRPCPEGWDQIPPERNSAIAENKFRQDGKCFPSGRNASKDEPQSNYKLKEREGRADSFSQKSGDGETVQEGNLLFSAEEHQVLKQKWGDQLPAVMEAMNRYNRRKPIESPFLAAQHWHLSPLQPAPAAAEIETTKNGGSLNHGSRQRWQTKEFQAKEIDRYLAGSSIEDEAHAVWRDPD